MKFLNNKFDITLNIIFLFIFFPSFISGIFLPNLLVSLMLLYFIFFRFNDLKVQFYEFKKIFLIFFFFYLFLLFSSISSNYVIHSLETSFLYLFLIIYVFAFKIIFEDSQNNLIYFLYIGLFFFFVVCFDALIELFFGTNTLGFKAMDGRISGLFGDRWVIGSYLLRFLPLLFGIFMFNFESFSNIQKNIFLSILLFSILIIFFSGERAAFLLLFLYLFLMLIYSFRKISLTKLIPIIFIFIILSSMPFFFDDSRERIFSNFVHNLTVLNVNDNQYYAMYSSALKMFMDSLFIGVGPNNFRYACLEDVYYLSQWSCSTHPHNTIIQLLAETGIIGTAIVYLVFIYFIAKSINLIKKKTFLYKDIGLYSIQLCIIINLWPFIPVGSFFLSWNSFIYFLPLAIYLVYFKKVNFNEST